MNKLFTKIASVTLGFAMAIGVGVAVAGKQDVKAARAAEETVEFIAGTDTSATTSLTKSVITLSVTGGTFSRTDNYRCYAKNTMTISTSVGTLSSITFTFSGSYNGGWSESYTGLDSDSWTSPTTTAQARINSLVVTYDTGDSSIDVSDVESLISAIGTVAYTTECKDKIDAARYLADLYAAQEGCDYSDISNYLVLTNAETTYANLEKQSRIDNVEALINAIGTVEYTAECKAKIDAARAAADAYVEYEGYAYTDISNYSVLVAAEEEYEALAPTQASYVFTDKDLHYASNSFGGTWTITSGHNNSFETSGNARGVQVGAAKGEGELTLNISSLATFADYVIAEVRMVVSTNGTGNTLSVSVDGNDYQLPDTSTTKTLTSGNTNIEVSFSGDSCGDVVVAYDDTNKSIWFKSISLILEESSTTEETITLSAPDMNLGIKDSDQTITVVNADTSAVVSGCDFTSNNENVATVISGKVHPVAKGTTTVVVTHEKIEGYKFVSTTFTVTVTGDSVKSLYKLTDSTTVEFDAYYAGSFANGVVVMDGEDGVILYKATPETTWVVDQTVLHVQGTKTTYKNLIEVNNATITVQESAAAITKVDVPSNYTVTGSESASDLTVASRRTFASGDVTSISSTSSGYNITIGGKAFYLYNDDASKSLTIGSETTTIIEYLTDKKDSSTDKGVTVKGFTSFFNSFQICIYEIVLVDDSFTVEQFAQMILDETNGVCKNDNTTDLAAITAKWNKLGGEEGWEKLSTTEREKFQDHDVTPNYDAEAAGSHTVLENALGRYNVICKRYFQNNNFANRYDVNGAPVTPAESNSMFGSNDANEVATIVVIIAIASISAFGFLLILKKRKHQ